VLEWERAGALSAEAAKGGGAGEEEEGSASLTREVCQPGPGSMAVAEQVQVLRLENEGLRVELSGSVRACRQLAEEREAAHLRASALDAKPSKCGPPARELSAALEGLRGARLEPPGEAGRVRASSGTAPARRR